jgi:AmiR/NasT family two-component response regulator
LQNLADIAATSIDQSRQLQQNRILVNQLQSALNSRVILEQAKGILAERMKVDFPTAFAELRSIARSSQRPIHQVAADIVHNLSHVPTSQFARVI